MIFEHGDIEEDITFGDEFVDFGGLEGSAFWDINFAIVAGIVTRDHFAAGVAGGLLDAAIAVGLAPWVAGMIEDIDAAGTGLKAVLDNAADQGRIGIGGLFRRCVPADIGFYDNRLALGDEAGHAAEGADAPIEKGGRLAAFDGDEVRERGVFSGGLGFSLKE